MRTILLLASVSLAAACASHPQTADRLPTVGFVFVDTDGDGLPDTRLPTHAMFVDTDHDGLPDTRLPDLAAFVDADRDGLPDQRAGGR